MERGAADRGDTVAHPDGDSRRQLALTSAPVPTNGNPRSQAGLEGEKLIKNLLLGKRTLLQAAGKPFSV
jgi:hypothetical protein